MESSPITLNERNFDTWYEYVDSIPKTKNPIVTLHVNIRSMLLNFAQLENLIASSLKPINIIILTEVNIKETCSLLFELPDYNMHTNLRSHKRGGGIIVYIHKSITFVRTPVCSFYSELLVGQLIIGKEVIYLCASYRPPDLSLTSFIAEIKFLISNRV